MKKIKNSAIFTLCVALIISTSCNKDSYTSANHNPNAPSTVTPATLLTSVEGFLAYTQGGDMSRFASIFVQQTKGLYRQSQAYDQYVFTGQDVDGLWGNMYYSVMENDIQLMKVSDAKQCNVYSGVSRAIMAYSLQLTVDNWGSIPFSKAFGGLTNLNPAYDADNVLYGVILSLCDSSLAFLANPNAGFLTPGSEDAIYGGDATKWIKFVHAIKARIYIHQSKGNAANAQKSIDEISMSFADNTDNAVYTSFGNSSTSAHPWYQFNTQRGDISFTSSTLAANMMSFGDPRFTTLIDTTGAAGLGPDYLGGYYGGNSNATLEFITYEELQFITAEAKMTIGGSGSLAAAQSAYQNGITASMAKLGISTADATAYLAAHGTLTAGNANANIAWEEYVALYLNPEAWTMWRRTGLPALTSNKSGASIPRRLLYPQTEYSYNKANTPAGSTMNAPLIFWDK